MADKLSVKDIMAYFSYQSSAQFIKEWRELTDADKQEIKELTAAELGKTV